MGRGREVRTAGTRRGVVVGVTGVAVSALALAAVPVGSAFGSPAAPSAQCEVEELELPSGADDGLVLGGDPTGRYIIGWDVLWTDGAGEVLTGPQNNDEYPVELADVNSSGVVTGTTMVGNDSLDPWTYRAGSYTDLQNESAGDTAYGINAAGDVVGVAWNSTDYMPQIWPADSHENPQLLQGAQGTVASAISDEGRIVGQNREVRPAYWPDSSSPDEELPLPAGVTSGDAVDIAGDWVVGSTADGTGLRWNLADGSVEELPDSLQAVNGSGDAAGEGGTLYRADGSTVELPAPDGLAGPLEVAVVFDPGAEYTAAGTYENADGTYRPLVWTC